jgi:hypothetical protein
MMTTQELIEAIKKNTRWQELLVKLTKRSDAINIEEGLLIGAVSQLEAQEESKAQAQRLIDLSKEMAAITKQSADTAASIASWTKRLAFATFVLALISALSILLRK